MCTSTGRRACIPVAYLPFPLSAGLLRAARRLRRSNRQERAPGNQPLLFRGQRSRTCGCRMWKTTAEVGRNRRMGNLFYWMVY